MFQLLQSIWMLAAAGVIIPVVIHLWNRKEGKTLKVGSISLITRSYKQQAKNLHFQELLLFVLRSLLIIIIAFLLSQPVWQQPRNAKNQKGWVLLEKADLQQTYSKFKPIIDSLINLQYEFHYFEAGFKKDKFANVLEHNSDTSRQYEQSYWSLLSSLDKEVPATVPVYLFTTNNLRRFSGSRSQVALNLQWYTFTPKDSVKTWLSEAYLTSTDSIRLVTASSGPSGTAYSYKNIPFSPGRTNDYQLVTAKDILQVAYQNNQPVPVDTSTLFVTVYADKYRNDAAYLKAALEAIQQFSKRKLKLVMVDDQVKIPTQQDWLFWLSDQRAPMSKTRNLFLYEIGNPEVTTTTVQLGNVETDGRLPVLYKRIAYQPGSPAASQTIWEDGFGNPLLTLDQNRNQVYHFFSRFDPSWSDIPWSNEFPQLIYNLIWTEPGVLHSKDNRIMDEQQLQPVISTESKEIAKDKLVISHELSQAFWIAAFIILFAERFISFKTKQEKANG